eukprot:gene32096-36232_t
MFMVHETPRCYGRHGVEMHDAATGKILWSLDGKGADVGRGVCMDIDPAHLGEECWASVGGLMSAAGVQISGERPRRINFGVWWDGDLLRESLDGTHIEKWSPQSATLFPMVNGADAGAASNNGTKATPVLSADLLGDWREEVVWRSADNNALLVFSTTATHDPLRQDLAATLQAPGAAHWFGTDEYGRDTFSRLVYGARTTLYIVGLVTIVVGPVGLAVGATSGYFGGWVDALFMRITDIFISFPSLVLALAFVAALGPGLEHAVIAIALTAWPPIARLARAETRTLRKADFVAAVQLQGASPLRILVRHIAPLCLSSVLVRLTMNMAGIILTAAGLGFLGLGAQPPSAEWGAMISAGRRYMMECCL